MAIYIENTQTANDSGNRSSLNLSSVIKYLFMTRNGLLFIFSQLVVVPIAVYQDWASANVLLNYFLYSFFVLIFSLIIVIIWKDDPKVLKEDVYFNGVKTRRVSESAGKAITILFFIPIILATFGTFLFYPPLHQITFFVVLLPLYQAVMFIHSFIKVHKSGLSDGIDTQDIKRVMTIMLAPFFRLAAINFVLTKLIFPAGNFSDLIFVLLLIGLTESIIYALEFAPGVLPVRVKNVSTWIKKKK